MRQESGQVAGWNPSRFLFTRLEILARKALLDNVWTRVDLHIATWHYVMLFIKGIVWWVGGSRWSHRAKVQFCDCYVLIDMGEYEICVLECWWGRMGVETRVLLRNTWSRPNISFRKEKNRSTISDMILFPLKSDFRFYCLCKKIEALWFIVIPWVKYRSCLQFACLPFAAKWKWVGYQSQIIHVT